jgi:hypothetical protein
MKGPSLSRHTSSERGRTAYEPSVRARSLEGGRVITFHQRRPGTLTFSFSHLFERARALSISLDQDGRHSRNDHRVIMLDTDDTVLERTSGDRRPESVDLRTQHARQGDAGLQGAFPKR